eukprot:Lankesteria_metandrocarpae@DN5990_c0_g1_i1.p1
MINKPSVFFAAVVVVANTFYTDAIRTGPYVQWTTDASKIPPTVLNVVDGHNVSNLLKAVSQTIPSAEYPYSVVLYVEPNIETLDFLMKSGAYSAETGDTIHGYLKTIVSDKTMNPVLNNYCALMSEANVEVALTTLSDNVSTCVVTDENDAMYRYGNKVQLFSSANLSNMSPLNCSVTVVHLGHTSDSSANVLRTTFEHLSEVQRKAGVGILGVYASVASSKQQNNMITERRMQEIEPPVEPTTLSELNIQPYQLSAVLTLSFMGMMVMLIVTCLTSIDTPSMYENKTLPINKEY